MGAVDESIKPVVDGYAAAVRAKDVEAFVALYEPEVQVVDMWAEWAYRGADAWRTMARSGSAHSAQTR
jgi:ketosteroid isomerase-like protein